MEASHKKHRPKWERMQKKKYLVPVRIIDQTFEMHTGLRACVLNGNICLKEAEV